MLQLNDSWVWDFWIIRDQDTYHAFFLYASRALRDPELRHRRAAIGHAVSTDLVHWERVADAVVHGSPPSFDQTATWTGSVVQGDDHRWYMFYTGATVTDEGQLLQQIGLTTSDDLYTWHKHDRNPLLRADSLWYEQAGGSYPWQDEHWRDPWVFKDPAGHGWHMLLTARANTGPIDDRGVIGHARSDDLLTWIVQPPLTSPGHGFGYLEVPQVQVVDGHPVLIFNCDAGHLAGGRAASGESGGVWAAPISSVTGPYDIGLATRLADQGLYVGKLVQDPQDNWVFLAFVERDKHGSFGGYLINPRLVRWDDDALRVAADQDSLPAGDRDARVSA
jgi:beta-fructofuranosidase